MNMDKSLIVDIDKDVKYIRLLDNFAIEDVHKSIVNILYEANDIHLYDYKIDVDVMHHNAFTIKFNVSIEQHDSDYIGQALSLLKGNLERMTCND